MLRAHSWKAWKANKSVTKIRAGMYGEAMGIYGYCAIIASFN